MSGRRSQEYVAKLEETIDKLEAKVTTMKSENDDLEGQILTALTQKEALVAQNQQLTSQNDQLTTYNHHLHRRLQQNNLPLSEEQKAEYIRIQEEEIVLKDFMYQDLEAKFIRFSEGVAAIFVEEDEHMTWLTQEVIALREQLENNREDRANLMEHVNARDTVILKRENEIKTLRKSLLDLAKRKQS